MKKRKLQFGETPWDTLTREELLREVQRMYAACTSAQSVLAILGPVPKTFDVFWNVGSGRAAADKLDQIIGDVEARFDSESVYRAFFRYACDLLFRPLVLNSEEKRYVERSRLSPPSHGFGWRICAVPDCGVMTGHDDPRRPEPRCAVEGHGPMRPLEWRDLEPRKP
jgi:hypothetical protein